MQLTEGFLDRQEVLSVCLIVAAAEQAPDLCSTLAVVPFPDAVDCRIMANAVPELTTANQPMFASQRSVSSQW